MAKREAQAQSLSGSGEAEGPPDEPGLRLVVSGETVHASVATPARPRNLARERLYADIGGTIIGLSGAAALIDFVLLR